MDSERLTINSNKTVYTIGDKYSRNLLYIYWCVCSWIHVWIVGFRTSLSVDEMKNMNYKISVILILIALVASVLLSGCLENTPDMKLQEYKGEIISMELNHAMTTNFCRENGYDTSEQWIIGEEHSGMYGQRVGYDIYGGDGGFNSNDIRVHVDCIGTSKDIRSYTPEDTAAWLKNINIEVDTNHISNTTYNQFCQQYGMSLYKKSEYIVSCYRAIDITKEYTPQEISRWYIEKGLNKNN